MANETEYEGGIIRKLKKPIILVGDVSQVCVDDYTSRPTFGVSTLPQLPHSHRDFGVLVCGLLHDLLYCLVYR